MRLRTLYYVTGLHHRHNEWWRFVVSADNIEAAIEEVKNETPELSRIGARALCSTEDDVLIEL